MTQEQLELMRKTTVMIQTLTTALDESNTNLNTASQKIIEMAALIKTAPGTTFDA